MAAHQAPLALGFSRQEHWSGLPFPSPVHESEKWKWSRLVVSDSERMNSEMPINKVKDSYKICMASETVKRKQVLGIQSLHDPESSTPY